jgi:thiamine pyrophosphate-dependent acetolactate synthase large subunit-like protein
VYSSDETVEIVIEAANDLATSDRRRFALLNIPKHLFSSALDEAASRKGAPGPRPA